MSRQDHEVADQLRASLHRGADALPYGRDMAGAAIHRARTIRRRRRTAVGVAAFALATIAVPVGMSVTDDATRTAPVPPATERTERTEPTEPIGKTGLTLELGSLPPGEVPGTPWADGATYRVDERAYPLPPERVGIARSQAGAVFVAAEDYVATLLTADGDVVELQPEGTDLDGVASSPSGSHTAVVYAGAEPDGERSLAVFDAATDETTTQPLGVNGQVEVVTVGDDGVVLMAPEAASEPALLFDGESTVQEIATTRLTAWSFEADLRAHVTAVTDFGNTCSSVQTGNELLWDTCNWRIASFSPDGRWAYALPAYSDGIGDTQAAVLDTLSGETTRVLRFGTDNRYPGVFRDGTWEAADSLLLQVDHAGQAALLRLDVLTGEVELAAEPVPYTGALSGEPPPYLLG